MLVWQQSQVTGLRVSPVPHVGTHAPSHGSVPLAQTQVPPWQTPPLPQAGPFAVGVHMPGLQRFLPFFRWHSPFWQRPHSPLICLHLLDLAAPASLRSVSPSRPSAPPRAASNARRREAATV